ncbi:MAG: acyl-CoA dehydrogenase family protein [Pseudomonadota bacterium]
MTLAPMTVASAIEPALPTAPPMLDQVDEISRTRLAPMAREIDAGAYPTEVMRAFGAAGAYGAHLPEAGAAALGPDLGDAIRAMARASEECISTGFCMWCQNALGWYVYASENPALKSGIGEQIRSGAMLGGTGLSNPMKTFFGIETMRLKGVRVAGGYQVKGALPWVSNLVPDSAFGMVFEVEDAAAPGGVRQVMAVAKTATDGVKIVEDHDFVAMGGTQTYAVQFRDALIPDSQILADPIDDYLKRIRAGFVLMQCGMALGMVKSCIALMRQVERQLGHVNRYLEKQPADFEEALEALEAEVYALAKTPFDPDPQYFRRVVQARLDGGEAAMSAAHYAMLHCGARGYVGQGVAQRRLRESYFIGIVTPATKQLRKMLAELPQ